MLQIEEKLGSIRLNCLCSSFFFLFLLVVFFLGVCTVMYQLQQQMFVMEEYFTLKWVEGSFC